MTTKKLTKLLALYLPYILLGLVATNFGEAWRLAEGKELGDKIMSMMGTVPLAFASPLPSLHPLDLLVGLCCGAGLRLAVYLRGKNAKKYRHGMEYGSARWGTPKDIEPFMAPKFEDNIILTKTECLMMSNRPPDPKNARNKNVLVVGGSGSGKTRFWLKPNLLQCHSSYVVNIDHSTLIGVLNRKIKDARFLNLIRMFLKSGYMEDWDFHETYSGCPQGGIISPILANVYLNELDRYITQLKKEFDHGYNPRNFTEEYNAIRHKRDALHEKIKKAEGTMREQLIAQHKQLTKQLFRTPAKACTDKRLKYVRYADDFLIAVNGTREECEAIKAKLTDFVRDTLKMELSQEKTLITHSNTPARFLGFDVRVRRDASVKRSGKRKMRTMNNKVELNIPLKDKVETYLLSHSIAKRDGKRLIPIHRPILLNRTDLEIVMIYNAELRGLCNYYAIASNFNKLVYFGYLMEYSCLKTLANKHRSRISKVRYEYRDGTGAWGVPYETKKGKRRMMFAKYSDCKGKDLTEKVPDLAYRYSHNTTSFEERLKAKVCEVCGCTDSDSYEIHHVNKVKNLKGKADWEKVMLAKRRKTIVVCHKCHMRIHHGTKTE